MNTGIRLSSSLLIAAVTVTLAIAFAWIVVRQFTATVRAKTMDRPALVEAVRLAPLNAEYRTKLGYYYLYADQDAASAQQQFRAAIDLAPTSPNGWLGLAKTELNNGDSPAAVRALDKAISLDPKGTPTLWEAGNLYLVVGETKKGLNQFKIAANSDPALSAGFIDTAWRATRNVDLVIDEGLPSTVDWRLSLVELLISRQQTDAAIHAWDRLIELKQPVAREKSFFLIDYLIASKYPNDAYHVWQSFLSLSPEKAGKDGGAITNGGFESPGLNGGFDWRMTETSDVSIGLDTEEKHSGAQSLALQIKSARLPALPVMQFVKLRPSTRYHFRAFVKGDLATASGVRFAISEFGKPPLAHTDEINGQGKWTEVSTGFTTGADATIGAITLVRERGETLVRGNLWIDDVSLTEEQ